jgi:hypothetical protein
MNLLSLGVLNEIRGRKRVTEKYGTEKSHFWALLHSNYAANVKVICVRLSVT